MRAIGALYMRLVGKALDVYQYLEPLLNDYRKLRLITGNEMASHTKRDLRRAPCLPRHRARASRAPTTARQCCVGCASAGPSAPRPLMRRVSVSIFSQRTRGRCRHPERMAWAGYDVTYMDEFIDKLLREDMVLDIALPTLPKRMHLEEARQLQPRVSALEDDLDEVGPFRVWEGATAEGTCRAKGRRGGEGVAVPLYAIAAAANADAPNARTRRTRRQRLPRCRRRRRRPPRSATTGARAPPPFLY